MDKQQALNLADFLLSAVLGYASPSGTIQLPGKPSKWGTASDGFEGVSRPLMLAAFRLAGSSETPDWYERLLSIVESGASVRGSWPEAHKTPQALVETASLALSMRVAGERLFDPLSETAKDALINRFRRSLDVRPSDNNWVMFPHIVANFLEAIGFSDEKTRRSVARSRERTESWYRGDGLYTDGSGRTFDYYNAWAFNFYLPLISHFEDHSAATDVYGGRLAEYCRFARNLVEPSGAPVFFGRSLTYRYALAAPFALSSLLNPRQSDLKENGRLWSAIVNYFMSRGAASNGLLSVGWHGEYRKMAQRYTGPASPYWAAKAFSALLIPNQSEFWEQDVEASEAQNVHSVARTGLIASKRNSVAILHNHGIDHQKNNTVAFFKYDALYARRSYSSRTAPVELLGMPDNSFGLLKSGRMSGRGIVQVRSTSGDHAASSILPTFNRRLLSSKLLDFGKLARIGPRVRAAEQSLSISEVTLLDDDWDIHVFRLSREQNGMHFRLTSWALPGESTHLGPVADNNSTIPGVRWRNATTGAELLGLHGFKQASTIAGEVSSPFGKSAVMGLLDSYSCEVNVFVAASRLYDVVRDKSPARPMVYELEGEILIVCTNGRRISVPKRPGVSLDI
jgi:hypothetical protein